MQTIYLTPGEPAGIGPDITLLAAQERWDANLIAIADPDLLLERAKLLNLPLNLLSADSPLPSPPGSLKIQPVKLINRARCGVLDSTNSTYVLQTLKKAAAFGAQGHAIVTGPVHKEVINEAGFPFSGHTEFFAQFAQVDLTVMLFVVDQLKVALLTTHLPLADVPKAVTTERLNSVIGIIHREFNNYFHLSRPRILVCGLNPHAGEGGYLGREEIETIAPAIKSLAKHYDVKGPYAADTLFTPPFLQQADVVLSLYHDQALPLIKHIGFGQAVNVTLGLPFLRTSVDHGTALPVAGTGQADASSLIAAIKLALKLSQ